MRSDLSFSFPFMVYAFIRVLSKRSQPNPKSRRIVSRRFLALALCLIYDHFEFILLGGVRGEQRFIFQVCLPDGSTSFAEIIFFSIKLPLYFSSKSIEYISGSISGLYPVPLICVRGFQSVVWSQRSFQGSLKSKSFLK